MIIKKYWELKRYYGKKICAHCGRKFTHRFIGRWDKIFGRFSEAVKKWEREGKVVGDFPSLSRKRYICLYCKIKGVLEPPC